MPGINNQTDCAVLGNISWRIELKLPPGWKMTSRQNIPHLKCYHCWIQGKPRTGGDQGKFSVSLFLFLPLPSFLGPSPLT